VFRSLLPLAACILSFGLGLGAPSAQEREAPASIAIKIEPRNAEGRLLINGVPTHRFGGPDDIDGGLTATTILWMVDGENSFVIEARPKGDDARTRVSLLRDGNEQPLFQQTIQGAGRLERKITANGLPRWGWVGAERWNGDARQLLAAVTALHTAYTKKDHARIEAMHKAMNDDFAKLLGPVSEGERAEERAFLAKAAVEPLGAELSAYPFFDNRLVMVARPDGSAPIRIKGQDGVSEHGHFWVRRGGQWQVVR